MPVVDWADLARAAARAADEKGRDVLVLEVGPLLLITEAFVLVTGSNPRQIRTIVDAVEKAVREAGGGPPLSIEGLSHARWVLMDFGSFVVHVFDPESRELYALERLWGDAGRLDLVAASTKADA